MPKKIKNCRACKSKKIKHVYSLGNQSLTGIFPNSKKSKISKGNLSLCMCTNCSLLQLEYTFDHNEMYGLNYGYMSSLNSSMEFHLKQKANQLKNKYSLNNGDYIIDIGSNDGTFLSFFTKRFKLIGCDPTINKFSNLYRKDIIKVPDFFSFDKVKRHLPKKAKLITSIAMFYDLDDPSSFIQDIIKSLHDNGVWHIELSYMPFMIKNMSYDTICHEHLEYYSLLSLNKLLSKNNLKIINIEFNQTNGGSFALDISKKKSIHKECTAIINWVLKKEKIFDYNKINRIKKFFEDCKKHKILLKELILNLKKQKKTILGYGASTKGNVILQYCNITNKEIKYIGEVNKFKFNKFTPGSKIKIISETLAKKMKPDYFLVLPWHFKEHIIKKEEKFLKSGGKMIFPLPDIEII